MTKITVFHRIHSSHHACLFLSSVCDLSKDRDTVLFTWDRRTQADLLLLAGNLSSWSKKSSSPTRNCIPLPPKIPQQVLQLHDKDRKLWTLLNSKNVNLRATSWPTSQSTRKNTYYHEKKKKKLVFPREIFKCTQLLVCCLVTNNTIKYQLMLLSTLTINSFVLFE